MSVVLSLRTMYEIARVTVPSFADTLAGTLDRDKADQRLAEFAQRVIANARIRLEVEGRAAVPADQSFVYMSNHQSHVDIPVLYATVPARTLRMVAKKELFRIPIWNRAIRAAGFVEIDRGNRGRAIASLQYAAERIREGMSIWIAPEGRRSHTGQLGPLKKGGFHLAKDTGTPILPVAISGTHAILPPGSTSMAYDRPVRVVFGTPIPVQDRSIEELMHEVETFLARHIGQPL